MPLVSPVPLYSKKKKKNHNRVCSCRKINNIIPSYCYHYEVDSFPGTPRPEAFYSSLFIYLFTIDFLIHL